MKRLILFDFDSTIFYLFKDLDRTDLINKLNSTLKKYGINDIVDRNFFNCFLYAKDNLNCLKEINDIITNIEIKRIDEGSIIDGFLDLIYLLKNKYKIGVVSNNSMECFNKFKEKYLNEYNIPFFGRIENNPDLMKPNPYLIDEAISYFNISKEDVIYIGDNVSDYIAANKAGISFIGFGEIERKYIAFKELNKDFPIVKNYLELKEYLI